MKNKLNQQRVNTYAKIMGLDFMEEFITLFLYIHTCDEFEAVREHTYPSCPLCNAKADSDGYIIHGQGVVN